MLRCRVTLGSSHGWVGCGFARWPTLSLDQTPKTDLFPPDREKMGKLNFISLFRSKNENMRKRIELERPARATFSAA